MGYEIVEQLGWRMPDVIVYPTGGGVGLIGIHKALHELRELGWVAATLPRLVAVQSTGCAPIVRAFDAGARPGASRGRTRARWRSASPCPAPLGDELILAALRATGGHRGRRRRRGDPGRPARLRRGCEGCCSARRGRRLLTAVRGAARRGGSAPDERVVVLNTGSGLNYPETVAVSAPTVSPGD